MKRIDLNKKKLTVLNKAINLNVYTKVPEKWLLFDTETGELYKGTQNQNVRQNWKKINGNNLSDILTKNLDFKY